MKKKINVAMIGYQFMGRAHSNAWRQVGRFFDTPFEPVMKVVCGRHEEGVKKAAETLGWQEHATSWEQVVARKDVDIVDVCTPGDSHMPISVAAAENKKVVFCEKPLANTLPDAQKMLDAVKKAGVIHMICHNYRRVPAVTLARQIIQDGKIGQIYHYRGTYLQDWIVKPDFPRVWRLEKSKAGSGALGDLSSHFVDLARMLVGEIAEVAGFLKTFINERPLPDGKGKGKVDVDDAALSMVKFQDGAIGTIESTRFALGRKNYNRFEINGSLGSVAFNLERLNELELYLASDPAPVRAFRTVLVTERDHPYMKAWWPPGHIIGWEHTFTHTVFDLIEAIANGTPVSPSFEDGVRNQRVIDAIEHAAQTRAWVAVDGGQGRGQD